MIAVAIPFIDQPEITQRCLEVLVENSRGDLELILVDNGSKEKLKKIPPVWGSHYIRNETNQGVLTSLKQALEVTNSKILLHMHNDVLIWEPGWDLRIEETFKQYPRLGLAGFFGAKKITPDGARIGPESNMLGKEWGTPGSLHGSLLTGLSPSVIFDSLAMIWRVSAIKEVGIPDEIPPHHWYDRILTLRMLYADWNCATIGIAFDHAGSLTYGATDFSAFAREWCERFGVDPGADPDLALYNYGKSLFERDYVNTNRVPLEVFMEDGGWIYI